MKKLWEQPLRRQLFVFILLLLVPVLAAAVWSGLATYRERVGDLNEQTRVTATTIAATLEPGSHGDGPLDARTSTVAGSLESPDPGEALRIVRRMQAERPGLLDLAIRRRSGEEVARAVHTRDELSGDWWSDAVFKSGGRVVAPAPLSREAQASRWVFAYPLTGPDGDVLGAAGFLIGVQELQDAYAAVPLPEGSVVSISDADGRLLARSVEAERYVGQLSLSPSRGTAPNEERDSIDGVRRVFGNVPIEGTPWLLSVGIPLEIALDRTMALWTRTFTVLALGLAGWLVVAVVLSRRLGQSVAHLDAAAQRIASGDFSPLDRKPMATHEFAELQEAFDQMVRRFNETRTHLDAQAAEERGMREEAAVAAAPGHPPGTARRGRPARVRRRARDQQPAAGDSRLRRAAADAGAAARRREVGPAADPEGKRARVRHHPQPRAVRAAADGRGGAACARATSSPRWRSSGSGASSPRTSSCASRTIPKQHVLAALPELQQVVLNFVVNAEQSIVMSGRLPGRITVRTRDEHDHVVLEVEDTGPGIPPENEAKLFQPFYTTKPVGQGTGLGLSVSYGIIDSLDGRIGYRRAPAGGAIFYFELPAAPKAA